ncbi:hypothetical protein C4K01_4579 [Pseudomonas synxantha]|nr:hypothetical protein C4K01_4579 [Pseudomonas synxantha]
MEWINPFVSDYCGQSRGISSPACIQSNTNQTNRYRLSIRQSCSF